MNNIKNKIWWGIILIIVMIVVGGLISKSSNKVASEEKVRVAYLPGVQALPLYLALNKGYFKEAGLNVEAVKFDAPNQIIDALLSGQADAAFAAAGGITAVAESKKPGSIKVILLNGATAGHEGDSILVKKDSTITSVGQLRGKKVGVLPGIQWRTIAQHVFSENGLSVPADITLVELAIPLQAQALASGQVDALLAIEPVITVVRSNGIGKDIMTSTANRFIADPFYPGVADVTTAFIGKRPKVFAKFLEVITKATKEINANPNSARIHLKGYTALTDELLQKVSLSTFVLATDATKHDVSEYQKFIDIFTRYGVITSPVIVSDFLYKPH